MRRAALILAAAGLGLAACGQSGSSSTESAAAPAPAPTPDQVKAMVANLPAPFNTGDPDKGRSVFTQCAACHTTAEGGPNMTGPNLWGIFGRPVAHLDSFSYSDALKAQSFTWDAARIDKWITKPSDMVPGTKMTFVGLPDAQDRINVIAYLKTVTSAPGS